MCPLSRARSGPPRSTLARSARAARRSGGGSSCSRLGVLKRSLRASADLPGSTWARALRPRPRSRSWPRSLPYVPVATAGACALRASAFTPDDGMTLRELLEQHAREELDLYARTINPQFIRLLRTIGFDRRWERAEGAYLYDTEGTRFLDLLGGFG